MNYQQAFNILELKPNFTKHDLKKAYHLKCLQYHPDKNEDGEEVFKQTLDAYNFLNDSGHIRDENTHNMSYKTLLADYIGMISTKYGWDKSFILNTFTKILYECQTLSYKLFTTLSYDKMKEIHDYLSKYNKVFHIDQTILDNMKQQMIEKEKENDNEKYIDKVYLHPLLDDLFENNVYKLERNNKFYYIPLWHTELYFNNNLTVYIIPDLSSNICIDENNNIHICITRDITTLLNKETLQLKIGSRIFETPIRHLLLRKTQTVTFSEQGLSKINTEDMFDIKDIADVIVSLHLRYNCVCGRCDCTCSIDKYNCVCDPNK